MAEPRLPTIIVAGSDAAAREQAIYEDLQQHLQPHPQQHPQLQQHAPGPVAILLEGLPAASTPLQDAPGLRVIRSAPGCLCCTGNLVLKVNLNRLLRERPSRLYLAIASEEHLDSLRGLLAAPPYNLLLDCQQAIRV